MVVEVAGDRFELLPGDVFTFGRDRSICTLSLGNDPLDRGISRLAGAVTHENGVWWIVNRSTTRSLHVVDVETGIAVPLPVARENWPAARHAVDRPRMTVLVTGEVLTHTVCMFASEDALPAPEVLPVPLDPVRTNKLLPHLTDKQREGLAAMVEGYLVRFPHYHPEPRTYEEAAQRLGLPATTVRKRIEGIRHVLVEAGVPGLEGGDARRNLSEWLLSNRLITADDLVALEGGSPSASR